MKHENNGKCPRCQAIFDRYPGFHPKLRQWFEAFQTIHPEAHISCAGRGRQDQEEAVVRGASKAHFGKSAHNFNAAIDLFETYGELHEIYESGWFKSTLAPALAKAPWLEWYGKAGAAFYELPHIEVKDWRALAEKGELKLVEA